MPINIILNSGPEIGLLCAFAVGYVMDYLDVDFLL